MTQLHFTINQEEIQSLINESVDNKISRSILTKVFNQLMEKERDEYSENKARLIREEINRERDNIYRNLNYSLKKPGLDELLNFLYANNISCVVATSNSLSRARYLLKIEGILKRFDSIISAENDIESKPSPDIFLEAIKRSEYSKNEALILEDSENGYLAAKSSGLDYMIIPD